MPHLPSGIRLFSTKGQVIAVLLYVLDLQSSSIQKDRALAFIRHWKLLAITDDDEMPYPSRKQLGGIEPRWQTLVAFGRQDCVDRGWMKKVPSGNNWRISPEGKALVERLKSKCRSGLLDVRLAYFWSTGFKSKLSPQYAPTNDDAQRPHWMYDDQLRAAIDTLLS